LSTLTRHPPPPLFPYTTLFRSSCDRKIFVHIHPAGTVSMAAVGLAEMGRQKTDPMSGMHDGTHNGEVSFPYGFPQAGDYRIFVRSEEHTSELQSLTNLVCRLLL